jgi:drug/metabolite transporter (DMT)-like permease
METLAIIVSGIGHACWDYQLNWMSLKDPDASILHMHWLRLTFMMFFLQPFSYNIPISKKTKWWWIRFSFFGFIIPSIMYTHAVIWTNYRISVSFQSFIPILVVLHSKQILDERRCFSLILTMFGTLCIWSSLTWRKELWMVWAALIASIIQVISLSEFFIMLSELKNNKLGAIARGLTLSVIFMFIIMVIFTPSHFNTILFDKFDKWLYILIASAVATGIKYGLIAYFSNRMTADGVAIFECVHPIATLFADILRGKDIFEWEDVAALTFFSIGWILYPKMNI